MAAVITIGTEPARRDLDVYPGEPVDFTEAVYDAAGALQDVSTWTTAADVRVSRDGQVLHTFTVSPGADGVTVSATGAETATWADWGVPVARLYLWLTPPANEPALLARGWVRIF